MFSQFYNILYHLTNGKIILNLNLPKIIANFIELAVENGRKVAVTLRVWLTEKLQ